MNEVQAMLQILNEYRHNEGLPGFTDKLFMDHLAFQEQVRNSDVSDFSQVCSILNSVVEGIREAEADDELQGVFREANLDWAYARKRYLIDYLSGHANKNTLEIVDKLLKEDGL